MNYTSSDKSSIFGNTYKGVPNPVVPHVHEYPTRFHGSVWRSPDVSKFTYRPSSYMTGFKKPVSGVGAADFVTALTGSPTGGSGLLDFLIGGVVGYAVSPDEKSKYVWAIAGGALTMILGSVGMAGVAGASIYTRRG
jgi:hypothetical protein